MNIYFGRANEDEFDISDLFEVDEHGETNYYYNGVEFGTNPGGVEEVRIFDTCNRSIPICVESIPELVAALQHCWNMHQRYEAAMQEINQAYEYNRAAVVEDYCGDFEVITLD